MCRVLRSSFFSREKRRKKRTSSKTHGGRAVKMVEGIKKIFLSLSPLSLVSPVLIMMVPFVHNFANNLIVITRNPCYCTDSFIDENVPQEFIKSCFELHEYCRTALVMLSCRSLTAFWIVSFHWLLPFILLGATSYPTTQALSNPKPSKYYRYKTFKRLSLPALAYSAFSKTAAKILQVKPKRVDPTISSAIPGTRRKVALVTGSNTGVGFETAKVLVQEHGYEVILACRSVEKGVEACQAINRGDTSKVGMAVFVQAVDVANFTSIESFAMTVNQQYDVIDVLINNAGRNSAGEGVNHSGADALCPIFATNFLGHFLLTRRLLDKCHRIVNVASVMHHFPLSERTIEGEGYSQQVDIDRVDFWQQVAHGKVEKTYAPSKLAALLFTLELNRRYADSKGIRSIAVNPGAV